MSQVSDIERAPESSEEDTDELAAEQPEIEEEDIAPAHASKRRKVDAETKPNSQKVKLEDVESDGDTPAGFSSQPQLRKKANTYSKKIKPPRKIKTKYDERIQEEKRREKSGFQQPPRFEGTKSRNFVPPANLGKDAASEPKAFKKPSTLPKKTPRKSQGRKTSRKNKMQESSQPANPPQGAFVIPETGMLKKQLGLTEGDASLRRLQSPEDSSSDLSSATESEPDDVSTSHDPLEEPSVNMLEVSKKCPVCDKKLTRSTWSLFLMTLPELQRDARLLTRRQVQFHNFHQKNTAKREWTRRHYPTIDWTRLPERVNSLRTDVESVIDGTEPSIYADALRDLDKGRSSRRQKVASEFAGDFGSNSVGYYGGRGAQIIGVEVAEMFTSKFLEDAQHDIISAAGGIPMYIQKVIVPEVASRLISQDMGCELAEARDILKKSADLGQALCEEENDEVHESEDEDASQSDCDE